MGQTSWLELACVSRRCQVFVTNDSAPLHLAAAVGTPTVALFGPTDPARHVPRAALVQVIRKPVPCSPCYSTWCKTVTHTCMKQITVDEVAEAVDQLCASSSSPRT
jgi:ADP-heptose:LPS heptosyltransferase